MYRDERGLLEELSPGSCGVASYATVGVAPWDGYPSIDDPNQDTDGLPKNATIDSVRRKAEKESSVTRKLKPDAIRREKQRFIAAHQKGMKALKTHDFAALNEAIQEEREIIHKQAALVKRIKGTTLTRKAAKKAAKKR